MVRKKIEESLKDFYKINKVPINVIIICGLLLGLVSFAQGATLDGLVLSYSFNGNNNTVAVDDFGRYNATIVNGVQVVGKIFNGTNLSATNAYVTYGSSNFGVNESVDQAYVIWWKPTNITGTTNLFFRRPTSANDVNYDMYYQGSTQQFLFQRAREGINVTNVLSLITPLTANQWYMIVGNYNSTTGNISIYINGTYSNSSLGTGNGNTANGRILNLNKDSGTGNYGKAVFDIFMLFNRTLTPADITALWNNGVGIEAYNGPTSLSLINPSVNAQYQNDTKNYIETETSSVNVINVTTFVYKDGSLYSSVFNDTGNGKANFTNLAIGTYLINASGINSTGTRYNTETRTVMIYNALLNINTFPTSNFTANIAGTNYTSINHIATASLLNGTTYNIFIDSPSYAYASANYTLTQYINNITIGLYPRNSVNITIYDEDTGQPILQNISVVLSGISSETTYTTNTSRLLIENITDGNYSIKFSGANYTLKTYQLEIQNRSTQFLNAFLSTSQSTVIFTIKDFDSSATIEHVSMTIYRLINVTWQVVDSKYSDVTGNVQFYYVPNVKYQFITTCQQQGGCIIPTDANYNTKTFYLDPVISSTYTVRLQKSVTLTETPDYTGVYTAINITPSRYGTINNFTFTISSPQGVLTNYYANLSWPGGTQTFTGTNLNGQIFTTTFNITSQGTFNTINVTYGYDTTIGSPKSYIEHFEIYGTIPGTYTNNTLLSGDENYDPTWGLGLVERIIIVTFFSILFGGLIGALTGSAPVGLFIIIAFQTVMIKIGFIELWVGLLELIIIIFVLLKVGG